MPIQPAQWLKVALDAARSWSSRHASSKGAALALYTLLSLAPLLVLIIAAASLVVDPATLSDEVVAQMDSLMGSQGAAAIKLILSSGQLRTQSAWASGISAFIVLASATSAFAELKDSLDDLWGVVDTADKGIWGLLRERVLSLGLVLVLALMLLFTLALSAAVTLASALLGKSIGLIVGEIAIQVISFGVVTLLFAIIFKYLPATRIAWSDVIVGSILTAMLFSVGKAGIGLYLGHGGVSTAYGAAGSIVALILWIYYSAQIFYYGALFTHEYAMQLGSRRYGPPPGTTIQ